MTATTVVDGFAHPQAHSATPNQTRYIAFTVLGVALGSCLLVLMGRLDPAYGFAVPATACLAGVIAALLPRTFLMGLFVMAPLVWALGDASVVQGERARVNLPMFVGFVIVVGFCHLLLLKDEDPAIDLIRKLVLAMGVACLPSVFFAESFFTGAGGYMRVMCPYIVMFTIMRMTRSKEDVKRFARSMAWALLSLAVLFLIAALRSELWVDFGGYTRLGALYFQTQGLGMYLSVMVLVVLLNYLLTRKWRFLLLLSFPLVALFLTYYRTAWIGGVVTLVLIALHIGKALARRILIIAGLLLLVFYSLFWQELLRYDTQVDTVEVADKILSGRLQVDAIAIAAYLEAPVYNKIFGLGFFRAKEATGLVLGEQFMIHDDYLAFLIEEGVFALAAYLAIVITLVKRSRQGKRRAKDRVTYDTCGAAFALLVAIMIMGIPGAFYTDVMSNLYIYGIMGLMLSQVRVVAAFPVEA